MSVTKSNKKVYTWSVNGVIVRLEHQFAVSFNFPDSGQFGGKQERAMFYSEEDAKDAITQRLAKIVGKDRNMDAGVASLFIEAGLDEENEKTQE